MSKLYHKDSAILVLRTSTTANPITGAVNYASVNNTSKPNVVTWNNVDMKKALGELYFKFKTFNIVLKTISQPYINYFTGQPADLIVNYYLTGLQLKNNPYEYAYGNSRGRAYIGSSMLYPDVSGNGDKTFGNYGSNYPPILTQNTAMIPVTFYKTDVVNLTMYTLNSFGNVPTLNIPKPIDFIFQIVGVDPE